MTDDIEVTTLAEGEELAFARAVTRHFYDDQSDEDLRRFLPMIEVDRSFVARDGEAIVGNYAVDTATLSVPGGGEVGCAAVTAVGVAQTHRRRGLLGAMMTRGLDQAAERGEPVAALYASESAIYGRYGFGVSAPSRRYRLDRAHVAFADPVDPRLVGAATVEQALASWPAIYEAGVRRRRGGALACTEARWRMWLTNDPVSWRDGASARRLAHVPGRGYLAYRIRSREVDELPAGEVEVEALVASDAEAEQALWQHVCDLDLTTTITVAYRPPDDALPWMLTDRMRTRTAEGPPLYTRLLDVPAAFEARGYAATGRLVLEVHDATRDAGGRYELAVDDGTATCERADAEPDLELPIEMCSALWLGGVRATSLLAARRLVERRAGAAADLDRLLAVDKAPWTPFDF